MKVPSGTPVVADKGHDSDPLRDKMENAGYTPVIPHRSNRVKPCRNDAPAASLQASLARRAHQRLAALLSRCGRAMGLLQLHVRRAGVFELYPYGLTTVLKLSLATYEGAPRR